MPLRIFISSAYLEFVDERLALNQEIEKLQDLFIGMEFFGSDPAKPAAYCVDKVRESDLYIGLVGRNYGSIDAASGMSFTQLEYESAADHIPCLIYFKESVTDEGLDPLQITFRNELRTNHIVYAFKSTPDLRHQFLLDLIKLLRSELYEKIVPAKRGAIPAEALLSLSQGFIQEQIKAVGQDKYMADVYVTREAEKEIASFTDFEDEFRVKAGIALAQLEAISLRYNLGADADLAFSMAKVAMLKEPSGESSIAAVKELKRAFYFDEVNEAIRTINSLLLEQSQTRFDLGTRALQAQLATKPFVDQIRLAELHKDMHQERWNKSLAKGVLKTEQSYRQLLRLFPCSVDEPIHLANDLLKNLSEEINRGGKRCLVLVDKAGTGKTNVACRLADQLKKQHPVVLLSGQMELSTEYDIEFQIQQRLESAFSGMFADWMNRVSPGLREAGKWLFIIIDGINENSKRPLLIQLLKGLLPRLETKRIKLILTCRDLFWDVFRDAVTPYLFDNVVPLHEFSEAEWERAVSVYFKIFDVDCTLDKDAREDLRNPLLLRFFCEAHRGQHLGLVHNLRLLSVFDLYVTRIGQSVAASHASLHPDAVLKLLISVAHNMWKQRSSSVNLSSVAIASQPPTDSASVLNLVISENIILEQGRHSYSTRKSVRFVFDEFMEYMIARSWVDEILESPDSVTATSGLVQEAVQSLSSFPAALGAVLFLDRMLERRGSIVSEFVERASKGSDFLQESHQTSLLYAFESINFDRVDDDLITAVQKFEPHVQVYLRDRLAAVIMRILKARPDHPYARQYVHKVLEVTDKSGSPEELQEREAVNYVPLTAAGQVADSFLRAAGGSADPWASKFKTRSTVPFAEWNSISLKRWKTKEAKWDGEAAPADAPQLPPARYHYSEETKINAIGILVQMKAGSRDYETVEEGIRKLGRTELHSALKALESLDSAQDELLYKTVASYMKMPRPEYRICCAWLLRDRYGKEAANYLFELLCDSETRVHEYAAGLFDGRLIETELVENILWRLNVSLKPWHLHHFIKLLRKPGSFHPQDLVQRYGSAIVKTLETLLTHQYSSIRLAAYRALAEYPTFLNHEAVRNKMLSDPDASIRVLAEKLISLPG